MLSLYENQPYGTPLLRSLQASAQIGRRALAMVGREGVNVKPYGEAHEAYWLHGTMSARIQS